jgi:L-threonylcarbamoyladenylate synthase
VRTVLTTSADEAAGFIKTGGIVAFPTETVYGLGADVYNELAISKIFEAKRRPADNPLIAHVARLDQIEELTAGVPPSALGLIEHFFPGPLTLVLKKADRVPSIATAGLDTVGVRMPENSLAHEFLTLCCTPIVAPSANISGRPSPTSWQAVYEDLDGRIDCILQGNPTDIGLESTVVDCTSEPPVVLRSGSVSIEVLSTVIGGIRSHHPEQQAPIRSPGLRHKHYAPNAKVVLVDSPSEVPEGEHAAYIGLEQPKHRVGRSLVCASVEEYARGVFAFFRDCDRAGIKTIYCQKTDETGIGTALMDRLRRAGSR